MNHDNLHCPGPICAGDDTPGWKENVIWYPGEPLCRKYPYEKWQNVQRKINRLYTQGKLKYPYTFYTASMLEKINRVRPETKGGNPNENVRTGREVSV
ncbi:hypothetical protein A3F57_03125 [Candidatus Roizmanbacteria bacterium RIFCSPHIGHO2_12_FULL_36_11]|uniref:Uncharacterized protein n=1 Tax=Candidatus Curtissbacteria bacterium RIFCSPLOWO2_01_FULL_37_9 TaxID=1797724 RepID=A0A1F5GUI0_9BACT|nr:MAG: hypothetical protein A3A48_03620 [Candidatus Curtissbacteria bacterium RIFCSPLOWO2_01_FULL_37_9]OGK32555.1 MAG: hypothetical protein A3F57_03125 [Candidatus Roizmanbacteria bacterium RIFCSPHIGHO2_12_FULL_36_11]